MSAELGEMDWFVDTDEVASVDATPSPVAVITDPAELQARLAAATQAAMAAMTQASELGVIMGCLRECSACDSLEALGQLGLRTLAALGVHGAICMFRPPAEPLLVSDRPDLAGAELATLLQARGQGRILSQGWQCLLLDEELAILVRDMPEDDPIRAGNLRDHLGHVLTMLIPRAQTIRAETLAEQRRKRLALTSKVVCEIIADIERMEDAKRNWTSAGSELIESMLTSLRCNFATLSLSETEEGRLVDLLECASKDLAVIFEQAMAKDQAYLELLKKVVQTLQR